MPKNKQVFSGLVMVGPAPPPGGTLGPGEAALPHTPQVLQATLDLQPHLTGKKHAF